MTRPWFRLDVGHYRDPRIRAAGWEAGRLWSDVLSLLKENEGVLDDAIFSASYLAQETGCPPEFAERAIAGIKKVELLVRGVARWKEAQGVVVQREGWLSLRWAAKRNAPPSWEVLNPAQNPTMPMEGHRSAWKPIEAHGSPSSDRDSRADTGARTRVRAHVPSCPSDSPVLEEEEERESFEADASPGQGPPTAEDLWQRLAPRHGRPGKERAGRPDKVTAQRLAAIAEAAEEDDIAAAIGKCAGKTSPLAYFCALFDEHGRTNPAPGPKLRPARSLAARGDEPRNGSGFKIWEPSERQIRIRAYKERGGMSWEDALAKVDAEDAEAGGPGGA